MRRIRHLAACRGGRLSKGCLPNDRMRAGGNLQDSAEGSEDAVDAVIALAAVAASGLYSGPSSRMAEASQARVRHAALLSLDQGRHGRRASGGGACPWIGALPRTPPRLVL